MPNIRFTRRTERELRRLKLKIWKRYTRGTGYQPFGYDWRTFYALAPMWATAYQQACERLNDLDLKSKS